MNFTLKDHLLNGARLLESPNCSDRPDGELIDLLIIHNISLPPGQFGTGCVDELFCNELRAEQHPFFEEIKDLRVSAHLLIDRQGIVTQYVPFDRKAWHAGESEFAGRKNCNEFSIGIELEGTDYEPFTDAQYVLLQEVTLLLMQNYPGLNADRIVGHSDVAAGRKTDPGPYFDWERYRAALSDAGTR